ncbi:MAG: hypothetical protein Q9207_006432, partial [Kuettlingeria erythrocarpa]
MGHEEVLSITRTSSHGLLWVTHSPLGSVLAQGFVDGGIGIAQDMTTRTLGGNDANLRNILQSCIYQWNYDPDNHPCEARLSESQRNIDDPRFARGLDDLLNALKEKMANANAKIYWTGYSHFWNASTEECNGVSWAFKEQIGQRNHLLQERRITMNKLVDGVNEKIQDTIERFGDQAVFVPWGANIDYISGHFCERGVDEWKAKDREQTAFYEWGTTIDDEGKDHDELLKHQESGQEPGQEPGVLQQGQNLNDTCEGQIAAWVQEGIAQGAKPEDYGLSEDDVHQASSGFLLPDKYGRIFHAQRFGHLMIAENILRTMDLLKAKQLGQNYATTTLLGCPQETIAAGHIGDPSVCYADDPQLDSRKFGVESADAAIKAFCEKHGIEIIIPDRTVSETLPNGEDKTSSLTLTASIEKYDSHNYVGNMNFYDCSDTLTAILNDCDTDTTTEKSGGTKTADCITYSIRATHSGDDAPAAAEDEAKCSLHLTQHREYAESDEVEDQSGQPVNTGPPEDTPFLYTVTVDIFGKAKVNIAHHDAAEAGDGYSLEVKASGLGEQSLVVTPEEQGDYVQFGLGELQWVSSDDGACEVGGWDPRDDAPA